MKTFYAAFMCSMFQSAMATEVYTVPVEIRHSFEKNKCVEVTDYYSEERVFEKPYLYGVRSVATANRIENDYSFIAWCKSVEQGADRAYVLVGQLDGAKWPGGCKFPIRGFDYAGGLSVSIKKSDLGMFTDFAHNGVGRIAVIGPVIRSERDGLAYEVLCHRGAWVKRNID